MLPIKLKMSAFCSYLEETEIDFTKFGSKGLYLITGDTGAGKTTIFDAISYALYNQASGDNRDTNLLRSKNAPPDVPTYVELTFMSKGKKYTVRRSPAYERAAKRGGKTTTAKAEAAITYYDGDQTRTEILRSSDNTIEDIIGIDAKKFKQLSMIAQGAFMRVLNSDTAEKTEILRAIFNTEKFDLMQDELDALSKKYKEKYVTALNEFLIMLRRSSCDESSPLKDELAQLMEMNSSFVTNPEKFSELLIRIIDEDTENLSKLIELTRSSEELIGKKQTEIGEAKEREKTRRIYLDTQTKLEAAKKQLPLLENAFHAVENNEEKASALVGEIKLLNEKLADYQKLDVLKKQLSDTERQITKFGTDVTQKSRLLDETAKNVSELRKELDSYKDSAASLEKLRAENTRRSETKEKYTVYYKDMKDLEKKLIQLDELQKKYLSAKNDHQERSRTFSEMNNAFLDEQAGIIAENLTEGQPCPVCGSTEHPHIAKKRPGAPTKAQVDSARKAADAASELASKASSECSSARAVCDQKKEAAQKISEEIFGDHRTSSEIINALIELGVSLKNEIEKTNAEIEVLNKQCLRKKTIETSLPKLEAAAEETRSSLEKIRTEKAIAEQKKTGISQQIKETADSLPYPEKALVTRKIQELTDKQRLLVSAYKTAEKELSDCRASIREKQATLQHFGEISLDDERESIEKAEREVDELRKENSLRSDKAGAVRIRIKTNKDISEYILSNSRKLTELQEYSSELDNLKNTAMGSLTGREKITLEVFAQTRYFDSILSFANLRLRKMSNGKYEFKRSQNALDKKAKRGLDIDVIDHDSGSQRSVRSLSGGESFMASLSLALGFSDVIQSNSGGVHLETMFVDEGFGTLDDKALENAYRVFTDLSNDGSCLVGIISHVEDLKSRITNRIAVTKDASGNSHAKIETEIQ